MLRQDARAAGKPHRGQPLDRRSGQRDHRFGQRALVPGGDQPAGFAGRHQFRHAGDGGGERGATLRHRLHHHHRQPLGKARQDQRVAIGELPAHARLVQPAGQGDVGAKAVRGDQPLDLGAHLAVADQRQLDVGLPPRRSQRGQQGQMPLLLGKAADRDQPQRPHRRQRRGGGKARGLDPAMNDVDAVPMLVTHPAAQLAAAVMADRHGKAGVRDLVAQAQGAGGVELLGAVGGEAVADARKPGGIARHVGRIGAEMRVQVPDPQRPHPFGHPRRLGDIGQVPRAARAGGGHHGARGRRIAGGGAGKVAPQTAGARLQDMFGPRVFGDVVGIDQRGFVAAHGEAVDGPARRFQRADLAPDEAVGRAGIGVHDVADRRPDGRAGCRTVAETHRHPRSGAFSGWRRGRAMSIQMQIFPAAMQSRRVARN